MECEVECLGDDVVFDFVAPEEFFGGGAFAPDALLLIRVDVITDLVGVVGL